MDDDITKRIAKLIEKEHLLYQQHETGQDERLELKAIEVQLDQCWDLLRQRRAKREFGENPDEAQARSPQVVEHYKG